MECPSVVSSGHLVGLFRVLVRQEELARGIDQHRVQIGREPRAVGQAEIGAQRVEHRQQRPVPPPAVDLHAALRDLPGIPHPQVEKRLLPPPVAGGPGDAAESLRLRPGDREAKPADPLHLEVQVVGRRRPPGGEGSGSTDLAQKLGDLLECCRPLDLHFGRLAQVDVAILDRVDAAQVAA
jgi:hypothetical protein